MTELRRITAEDLHEAERILSRTYQIAVGASASNRVLYRARIEEIAANNFLQHHRGTLFKKYLQEVDPRAESSIMTMMLHMLCVGAVSQRIAMGVDE